jgi:SAM-dependent methyltransferase
MTDVTTPQAEDQAPLEATIKGEVLRLYQEVADHPDGEFHFFHGRTAAGWQVGPTGRVLGVDLNPHMCARAEAHAALAGGAIDCRQGTMEDLPLPDAAVGVVISNGVINLSFRKRRVIRELFRVLKAGGRFSIADIVSAKQLSQSVVNDPTLWAS